MHKHEGMTLIVKTVTRISVWMILLYGTYIVFHGHLSPGGGFAGGVIIALALLNVLLAYGRNFVTEWLSIKFLHGLESLAASFFVIIGILGMVYVGYFLGNYLSKGELFNLLSAGTILPLNIVIGIKVGTSLFIVIWFLSELKIDKGE